MASFDFASISAYKFGAVGLLDDNTDSVAIDTQGFEGVSIVAVASTGTLDETNTFTVNFLESDDTNISNASVVKRKDSLALTETNAAAWANVVPEKRYVFAQLIKGGDPTANIAVLAALGHPANAPT